MIYQLALLVLLSSLQPGWSQGEGDDDSLLQNIHTNIVKLNTLVRAHMRESQEFRDEMEESLSSLREDLSSLNDSVSYLNNSVSSLSMDLQELKEQTMADARQANSRLDTLLQRCDFQPDSPTQTTTTTPDGPATTTTTNMAIFTCGGTEGWRRAVYLNMTDSSTTCPSGWQPTQYSKKTCGRASSGWYTCDSVTFPVSGGPYSQVCGRIKAYQWGGPDAFYSYHHRYATTIDSAYVAGVSVTHSSPRQHIWTFAAGEGEGSPTSDSVCPCDADHTISVPPFVGNDYFCESGVNERWSYNRHREFHSNDPLWDGENCLPSSTCCSLHNPPYFVKQLPTSTTDDIEARICLGYASTLGDIAVELIEIYVQ